MFGKRSEPRTAEDRARAAAERAARRAGRPLPPEAFADSVRPPDVQPRSVRRVDEAADESRVSPPVDEAVGEPRVSPRVDEAAGEPRVSPRVDEPAAERPSESAGGSPAGDAAAPRARVSPRADEVDRGARDDARREELIHQPTVEYTPFDTEEHERAAPLGQPRDDEPRLVAALGYARRVSGEDEIRAYASARREEDDEAFETRPETSERDAFDVRASTSEHDDLDPRRPETAEHDEFDDQEPLPPLRRAPDRPARAPRRRPAPGAPRRRPPSQARPRGGGGHWGRRIFAVVALLVILGVLYAANQTFQPFHGDGSGNVAVDIPDGADAGQIGDILAAKGVVDSATFFEVSATLSGDRGKLRPGHYTLQRSMTNGAVIDALTTPPKAAKPVQTVKLTLVEGPGRKENAPVVDHSKKVEGSYAKASSSKAVLRRIRKLGAPKGTKTAEGFLFPATYELPVGSSAKKLVDAQLDAFKQNFAKLDLKYAKNKNLTRYDVLIIASMIEREAQLARERPLVSAVIYNRLHEGMPLQIDATIRYYTNNWQRPIRQSELDDPEPYNLSLNRGLPPTPIGNPGLASLKAAARPADKPYLFYVRKPGKSGEHAFSSNDAQFQKDLERYQASREGQ